MCCIDWFQVVVGVTVICVCNRVLQLAWPEMLLLSVTIMYYFYCMGGQWYVLCRGEPAWLTNGSFTIGFLSRVAMALAPCHCRR